jgi:SAM-dependent methyltransferase
MAVEDRTRWDERYSGRPPIAAGSVAPPAAFADLVDELPRSGAALEVASGEGGAAVWLATRGLDVTGVDVSPVAVDRARALAEQVDVGARCRFAVHDLDVGLPPGPPVALVLCHLFDGPHLDGLLVDRLAAGGALAVAVLSEVGGRPGRFRAAPGALLDRYGPFDRLTVVDHREADGVARLLARCT